MKRLYSECDLIVLLANRDRQAYHYLYDNYSAALYNVILKSVKKEAVAQDLLQDVFIKIWKSMEQYDAGKGRLFTWMFNIALNTSRDYLRTQHGELLELSTAEHLMEDLGDTYRGMDRQDVKELICRLTNEHKVIIEMVYWEGYTHEETALRLQLPLGTVKSRVRKALHTLRCCLVERIAQSMPVFH